MRIQASAFWRIASVILAMCALNYVAVEAAQLVSTANPFLVAPAGGGGDSVAPVLSLDGRYVLFTSTANNLSATSSNTPFRADSWPRLNVYLRDRTNATTTLVSITTSGTAGGNDDSIGTDVSTNGQYVLFESAASDLVGDDTNQLNDVFVRDLLAGVTHLVSVSTNGGAANGESRSSVLTPDGRFVAFVSAANNLVSGDANGIADVFVRDLQSNTTTLVSVGAMPAAANSLSEVPDITPDGRYVAFFSSATNLLPGSTATNGLYIRDLLAGVTYRPNTNSVPGSHVISDDGKYVAFEAWKTNNLTAPSPLGVVLRYSLETGLMDVAHTDAYAPATADYADTRRLDMTPDGRFIAFVANTNGGTFGTTCIRVWDAQAGTNALASGDLTGTVPNGALCAWPTIDPTGRFVAFLSPYTSAMVTNGLSTNSLGRQYHLYLRDTLSNSTRLVNTASNGLGHAVTFSAPSRLTAGGRFIAFQAPDGNLAPGDRNRYEDVFLRDMTLKSPELISSRHPLLPPATPNGASANSSFSANTDGSRVAFASDGDNLTGGDTNKNQDIFLRDQLAASNLLVSIGNHPISGTPLQYTNASSEPSVSADGRYVAHVAYPHGGTTIPFPRNVYVRDVFTGSNMLVSARIITGGIGNAPSYSPTISADGHKVLFRSLASDLVSGVSGENLFYRDLQVSTNRALTTYTVRSESMTPDGRWVAYIGALSAGVTNVYVWDSQTAARVYTNTTPGLARVGISPGGSRLAYASASQLFAADWVANTNWLVGTMTLSPRAGLRFSADGRFLTYACTNALVAGDTNKTYDVFLHDFQTGSNLLASHRLGSTDAGNGASDSPDISPDGRLVTYRSDASDLVPGDNNKAGDVFLFDRLTGRTTLLSANKLGSASANGWSSSPQFTRDGRTIFFKTWAPDLTDNDFNAASDLFAYAIFYADIEPGGLPVTGPTLSWPVEAGKTYRVEFLADLNTTNWQNAAGSVTIVGDRGYFTDLAPSAGQRFYRIVAN